MATYHLTSHPISRSAGRSATGAAAYRAGEEITDARTGQVHDYTRKAGVLHTELVLPGGGVAERSEFWNAIELHHKRGDAVLVREIEVSLPTELTPAQRQALAVGFASTLAEHYGVAADVALHAPRTVTDKELDKRPDQYVETDPATGRRHNGNWHAHILLSACHVSPGGELGKKAVELDPIHCQRARIPNLAERARQQQAAHNDAQAAAREYARQATAQFKAEQAAREFGRQAAAQLKQEIGAQTPAEPGREPVPDKVRQHVIAHTLPGAEVQPVPEIGLAGPKRSRDRGGPGHSR